MNFPRTKHASPRAIRKQNAHRRRASRRSDDGAARGTFLSPTRNFFFLLLVSLTSLSLSLSSLSYSTSSSRDHEDCAKKQRSTEEGALLQARAIQERERNDSSRRRAVLPRTSHPWFPPTLEPLNHSVVQRFEAPQWCSMQEP